MPGRMLASAVLIAALCCAARPAAARDGLPFGDEAPRYVAATDRVEVAAWGVVPVRAASLAQLALRSRESARLRALRALHGWIDAAMGPRAGAPVLMSRLHQAAEREVREVGVRHLADGTLVLCIELEGATLRQVIAEQGLPWVQ